MQAVPAVAVERRDSDQGGELALGEVAQFGQVGEQDTGRTQAVVGPIPGTLVNRSSCVRQSGLASIRWRSSSSSAARSSCNQSRCR